jgi:hypothetical protein
VDTVTGLPGSVPFTLVIDAGTSLEEIVDCTAVAGTVLTIVRGVDGSSSTAHNIGATVRHMAIGRDFREANAHVNATSGVHGLTGPLLGTTDTQAVFNKDLTSGTNTFPTSLATAAQLATHAALGIGVHGVTGSVVGTTDTQTLSNKTLASPAITGSVSGNVAATGTITGTNLPALMQSGQVGIAMVVGVNNLSQALTFPVAFAGTPVVTVSLSNLPGGSGKATIRTVGTTSSGTTLWLENGDGTTFPNTNVVTVDWIAVL